MAWIVEQNRICSLRIKVIENRFKSAAEHWSNTKGTDRALFCHLYQKVIVETGNMRRVKSNYINCAFNQAIDDDLTTMQGILDYFTGKVKRGYGESEPSYYANPEAIA